MITELGVGALSATVQHRGGRAHGENASAPSLSPQQREPTAPLSVTVQRRGGRARGDNHVSAVLVAAATGTHCSADASLSWPCHTARGGQPAADGGVSSSWSSRLSPRQGRDGGGDRDETGSRRPATNDPDGGGRGARRRRCAERPSDGK